MPSANPAKRFFASTGPNTTSDMFGIKSVYVARCTGFGAFAEVNAQLALLGYVYERQLRWL